MQAIQKNIAITTLAEKIYSETVQIYRQLHKLPQLGLQEHHTSHTIRQIISHIEELEVWAPLPQLPTAIIATLTPPQYTSTILLRCELDALPFQEQSQLSFSASNGLHHACGHDAHMAVMLSTIKLAVQERTALRKKLIFCFQPGEEGKQGARKLFQCCPSLMEAVNHCYALHFNNALLPGWIKVDSGPVTALSNRFNITIKGKSAHCLAPHAGVDANFIGCSLVGQLYSLAALTVPPLQGCSLVIYRLEGGSKVAMVSDSFKLEGSLRTFSLVSYQRLKEKMILLANNHSSTYQATAIVQFSQVCYRPVINDQQLVSRIRKNIQNNGQLQIAHGQKSFAGQDFCQFSQRLPSCYLSVGSACEGSIDPLTGQSRYPAHSSRHKLDEKALFHALKLWLLIIFQ